MSNNTTNGTVQEIANFLSTESKIRRSIAKNTVVDLHTGAINTLYDVLEVVKKIHFYLNKIEPIPRHTTETLSYLQKVLLFINSIEPIVDGAFYTHNGRYVPDTTMVLVAKNKAEKVSHSVSFVNNEFCDPSSVSKFEPSIVNLDVLNLTALKKRIESILSAPDTKCNLHDNCDCRASTVSSITNLTTEVESSTRSTSEESETDTDAEFNDVKIGFKHDEIDGRDDRDDDNGDFDDKPKGHGRRDIKGGKVDVSKMTKSIVENVLAHNKEKGKTTSLFQKPVNIKTGPKVGGFDSRSEQKTPKHLSDVADSEDSGSDRHSAHSNHSYRSGCDSKVNNVCQMSQIREFNKRLNDYRSDVKDAMYYLAMRCEDHQCQKDIINMKN
ncbi:hypothetical protein YASMINEVIRUS_929 [Yasminevirus sp. GU-2018]|uniref:Uncharacterized protein n=1 Tax=Yasminevirus sp. GU-2018 TaxID=2420051 RepID=A0A5K0UBJ2_9VIRU|nr:hypothetical protein YASMINEVIRUS_929 [Yasminevirus sp. GU-2018]